MVGPREDISLFEADALPLLTEPLLDEEGSLLPKYFKLLHPITIGQKPNYKERTGNALIDWCLEKLDE